jgi:hypothetical protein
MHRHFCGWIVLLSTTVILKLVIGNLFVILTLYLIKPYKKYVLKLVGFKTDKNNETGKANTVAITSNVIFHQFEELNKNAQVIHNL